MRTAPIAAAAAGLACLGVATALRGLQCVDDSRPSPDDLLSLAKEYMRANPRHIALSGKIRMRYLGPDRGVGLVAVAPIAEGEHLVEGLISPRVAIRPDMRHPWESDEFVAFLDTGVDEVISEMPGAGRLMLKLINLFLLVDHGRTRKLSTLQRYVTTYARTTEMYHQWPAEVQALLRGTCVYESMQRTLKNYRKQAPVLLSAWPWSIPMPSVEKFMEAWLKARAVISTRGFGDDEFHLKLIPVLDLLNHATPPHNNAGYGFTQFDNGPGFSCVSFAKIAPGDEVLVDYDIGRGGKSFIHTWTNYGFFDETTPIHEVWVMVPPGTHPVLQRFWYVVRDEPSPLVDSDLFKELRDHAEQQLGLRPSGARQHALQCMSDLFRAQLAGVPPGVGADEDEEPSDGDHIDRWEPARRAARRVVRYEGDILRRAVARVESLLEDGKSHNAAADLMANPRATRAATTLDHRGPGPWATGFVFGSDSDES